VALPDSCHVALPDMLSRNYALADCLLCYGRRSARRRKFRPCIAERLVARPLCQIARGVPASGRRCPSRQVCVVKLPRTVHQCLLGERVEERTSVLAKLRRTTARVLAEVGNTVKVCAVSNLSGDCMIVPRHGCPKQQSRRRFPRLLCLLGAIRGVSRLQLFPEKYRCGSPAFVPNVLKWMPNVRCGGTIHHDTELR
jgi:hypothetical protein